MFLARRPSLDIINRFLRESEDLPLSYPTVGTINAVAGYKLDEAIFSIGHGREDFERARVALREWKQFDLGWVEKFPRHTPVMVGGVVAILVRHLGFWSLNGCRVLYGVGEEAEASRFGFAYGTLSNHAESGEELFEVFIDPKTDYVCYRIRAVSSPQAMLARIGQPIARVLQARFRSDSGEAMRRAIRSHALR